MEVVTGVAMWTPVENEEEVVSKPKSKKQEEVEWNLNPDAHFSKDIDRTSTRQNAQEIKQNPSVPMPGTPYKVAKKKTEPIANIVGQGLWEKVFLIPKTSPSAQGTGTRTSELTLTNTAKQSSMKCIAYFLQMEFTYVLLTAYRKTDCNISAKRITSGPCLPKKKTSTRIMSSE